MFAIYSGIAIAWHDTGAYKVKGIASCDIRRKERITLLFAWLVQAFTLIADVILIYKTKIFLTGQLAKRTRNSHVRVDIVKTLTYLSAVHILTLMLTTTSVFMKSLHSGGGFVMFAHSASH